MDPLTPGRWEKGLRGGGVVRAPLPPPPPGGGGWKRGSRDRTDVKAKILLKFYGLNSRRSLRGINGARAGPRGAVPLVRSTVMSFKAMFGRCHTLFWRIQRGEGGKEKTDDWGREWRLSDKEVERIDLENTATPEEADKLKEMTADEMVVDGYYVVAGIAHHEYKQGWKFLTLWGGYGLSQATWEPMSAFIQPQGTINPIFRSYLVENNESQLLTRAETLS